MAVFILVNLQTAYILAGLTILTGAATVFFLRTLDENSTRLLTRLTMVLATSGVLMLISSAFLLEETLALGMHIANFAIVLAVIGVAELARRLMGLRKRTGLALSLVVVASLAFVFSFDAARPLTGNALRHVFECGIGLALSLRLFKLRQSGTPVLSKLLAITASLYSGDALFELANTLSNDLVLGRQGSDLVLGLPQTIGFATTSILSILFVALLMLTVNAQMANRLRHLLSTDELTRLGSRRSLNELGPGFVTRSEQSGQLIAVMMLDIDHFKRVNDRYGHPVGDAILRHCAKLMRESLRPDAMLARYGGEEFCALVPVDQFGDARSVAERLRQQVMQRPFRIAGFEIRCTISVGVALVHADQPLSDAIEQADQALYQAKRSGRNKVSFFNDVLTPADAAARKTQAPAETGPSSKSPSRPASRPGSAQDNAGSPASGHLPGKSSIAPV